MSLKLKLEERAIYPIDGDGLVHIRDIIEASANGSTGVKQRGNIYILSSGQSNMALIEEPTRPINYPDNLNYWNFAGWENEYGNAFRKLLPNESSAAMSYARMVAVSNPDSDVWLVNISFGGTPIVAWSQDEGTAAGSTVIENMKRAVAFLNENGHTDVQFDTFLWWQGESDADDNATEVYYFNHYDTWMSRLHGSGLIDTVTARIIIFGIADAPRLAWPAYNQMNKVLMNLVDSYGGQASYCNTGSIADSLWKDDVHLTGDGYYLAGSRAYRAAHGGSPKLGSNFIRDDFNLKTPVIDGPGITFPDRELDYVRDSSGDLRHTLYQYTESYLSDTLIVSGSDTVGEATYDRRDGQITRIGNITTFTFAITFENHTGVGNLALAGMPFTNLIGVDVPLSTYIEVNGTAVDAVALWKVWTKDIHFFVWTDGVLEPLSVSPNMSISINSTVLRIGDQ